MFGLMRVSTHEAAMKKQRDDAYRLNLAAWGVVVRMCKEVRAAQNGLYRLQRKLKRNAKNEGERNGN